MTKNEKKYTKVYVFLNKVKTMLLRCKQRYYQLYVLKQMVDRNICIMHNMHFSKRFLSSLKMDVIIKKNILKTHPFFYNVKSGGLAT